MSQHLVCPYLSSFFFFNDTPTTEIYTLSLHDRSSDLRRVAQRDRRAVDADWQGRFGEGREALRARCRRLDRKSTRLNSSHTVISYAVFCLKKKKKNARTKDKQQ